MLFGSMRIRKLDFSRLLGGVLLASLFCLPPGCSEKAPPPLPADELFQSVETLLGNDYYFAEGQGWNLNTLYAAAWTALSTAPTADTQDTARNKLTGLTEYLQQLPEADRRRESYAALRAMLAALPLGYNTFTPAESLLWSRDPERNAGVGLVLRMDGPGRFLAMDTLEGSASYRENMEPGNYVTAIDDMPTAGMDLEEVVGRIRGPAGTEVKLSYESGPEYTLLRSPVSLRNLLNAEWELPDGGSVEYIMLRSTLGDAVGQMRGLIKRVGERKAIILDLRRLHHGDYEIGFGVANLFVRSGKLGGVRFRDREPVDFIADGEQIFSRPIYVVLGNNASPFAETLAAALGVAKNVAVIGARGKGRAFVSSVHTVPGNIELTLTAGLVLGPNGQALYETGVPVDTTIEAPLPRNPPLKTVDQDDPVQVYLAKKLGL